ncbi:MAG: leucyl/phenylalanyl-tRNA--protein transferase [Planctomycetes bacterium]|nr:leucyl/phenylalanyl-tRNA--protein transferase [Planctomycetota bacterium]
MAEPPAPVVVRDIDGHPITPDTVLAAYRHRCFPMAESRGGPIAWYRPQTRAIITWDRFTVPRSLAKVLRNRAPYRLTIDRCFPDVIAACAERDSTWISRDVEALYVELHRQGHAHSVEAWLPSGELAGGLYGLAIGACFCGESMFHRAPDASKACVVRLAEHLRERGFAMIDCQQQTPHMQRFGAYEVADRAYARLLAACARDLPWT